MFNFVFLCPKRWLQFHSILFYLQHIETVKYNNDVENDAVCHGTMSLLRTQTRQTQHSPGVGYPSSSNTGQAEHVSTATNTRRPEKTSLRWAQGIWVGTKVGYGCRALLLDPNNELNNHRPSNHTKLFRHSFRITKIRLWIILTNVPVLR